MDNHLKQHIGYWLNRLRYHVHQGFEAKIARHNVSIAGWCILIALYDKRAHSINELSQYIEVDKASISRVVEKLVLAGWVSHGPGKDRRSGLIELTAAGYDLVPKLLKEANNNEEQFFSRLNQKEKDQLRSILGKVLEGIPGIKIEGWLDDVNKRS